MPGEQSCFVGCELARAVSVGSTRIVTTARLRPLALGHRASSSSPPTPLRRGPDGCGAHTAPCRRPQLGHGAWRELRAAGSTYLGRALSRPFSFGAEAQEGRRLFSVAASSASSESSADNDRRQTLFSQIRITPPEKFTVLGIETSCDDTGAAVITHDRQILGEAIKSQMEIHEQWGGIVPALARDAHAENIDRVISTALERSGKSIEEIDAIAVTTGPGLSICLKVGVMAAKRLAAEHQKMFISINHMEGHALVARLTSPEVSFPYLAMLISGGHNMLVIAHEVGRYTQLGTTLDDALGEAYDKCARALGLPVGGGGGPALEKLALEGNPLAYRFTLPLQQTKNCDFSYAGLKTAARLAVERAGDISAPSAHGGSGTVAADIAASFQKVATQHLEERTRRAVEWARTVEPGIRHLVASGGVASNQYIRARLGAVAEEAGLTLVCPPPRLCTDNGAMIAWVGVERLARGIIDDPEKVDLRPRWPLGPQYQGEGYIASAAKRGRAEKKKDVYQDLTTWQALQHPDGPGGDGAEAEAAEARGSAV
eukprot:tig00000093_g3501.t1